MDPLGLKSTLEKFENITAAIVMEGKRWDEVIMSSSGSSVLEKLLGCCARCPAKVQQIGEQSVFFFFLIFFFWIN